MSTHSRRKRGRIFEKTEGHCAYCGRQLYPFGGWHVEHVIPQKRDGSDHIDNLVAACSRCNQYKKGKTPEEFKQYIIKATRNDIDSLGYRLHHFRENLSLDGEDIDDILSALARASGSTYDATVSFYYEPFNGGDDGTTND